MRASLLPLSLRCVLTGLATLALLAPAHAQRVALLVGNASYSVGRLTNPPNDVAAMEKALAALGFKVHKVLNANQNQMKRAVRDFGSAAQGAEVAFLYYSGHGTQANGENYLLPVGASIEKESDYEVEAVSANAVLAQIRGAQPKAAILVLDACRDNPLAAVTKSTTKGLGRMSAPTGTMIAFATAPGDTASDNGHYARVLAKEIQKPGQELMDVFRNTAAEVRKLSASGKVQDPRISEMSINERLYLAGAGTQLASLGTEATGKPVQADPEQEAWELAKRRDTASAYQAYLDTYPKGRYTDPARVALKGLQPASQASAQQTQSPAQSTTTASTPTQPGQTFKDCADCPEMVVIPAGSFTMGSSAQEQQLAQQAGAQKEWTDRENPQHRVTLRSFALGQTSVTKGQFAAFVSATNYRTEAEQGDGCFVYTTKWEKQSDKNWRSAGFTQGDDHPVVCVSWNDAQAYIRWLNQQTGKTYRLPNESEREYATRAGTSTAFWWGDSISTDQANYNGNYTYNGSPKGQYRQSTVAANSFQPNPWGLYQMHGNVWEWVQDVFHGNYNGAPADGSAWETGGEQQYRVLRGGSCYNFPYNLRAAVRSRSSPGYRYIDDGFRLARMLP